LWLDIEDHVSQMCKEVSIRTDGGNIETGDSNDPFYTTEVTEQLINFVLLPACDHKNLKFYLYFRFSLLETLC